eukprot:16066-Heterococcus_DN1.PRE.1
MTHPVGVGYSAAVCRTTQHNDSAYYKFNIGFKAVKSHSRGYTVVIDSCDNVITSLTLSTTAVNMQHDAMNKSMLSSTTKTGQPEVCKSVVAFVFATQA